MKESQQTPHFEAPTDQGVGKLEFEAHQPYISPRQAEESDRARNINLTPLIDSSDISDQEAMRRRPEWTEQFRLQRR